MLKALICASILFLVSVSNSWAGETTATLFLLTNDGKLASLPLPSAAAVAANKALTFSAGVAITNISGGEVLAAIDVRPQTQRLYALGVNATTNTATLYHVSPETGFANAVGTAGGIAFTTDGVTPVDLPDPATVQYDIDFNPAADRLRVVAGSLNFRVNPNNGAPVDGDNTGLTSGNVTGVNPDGGINTGTIVVSACAYTNNQPNNGNVSTLYTLDSTSNSLFIQNPPNAGTQSLGQTLKLNGSVLDFTAVAGFDILPGVNAPAGNSAVAAGTGYAVLTVGGQQGLYSINLVGAAAAKLGNLTNVRSCAFRTELGVGIALSADGLNLLRFNTSTPSTVTTQALAGVSAGDTLVAMDWRPQTGQLYGFGVNAGADTGTLYLIDPQTGALTVVGTTGQIAFVDGGGNPVDFPSTVSAGYGFDFNPTVDRIRVTTSTGLNFRVNPNTGAPIDGDLGGAVGSVAGINPDGAINGSASTGVVGAAYTNNFTQNLSGGTTKLFTLDATQDMLFVQNPANSGTQTTGVALTIGSSVLNVGNSTAFDIPPSIAAFPEGWMVATVGGATGLYRLDLETGASTLIGNIGAGVTAISGLAVFTSPALVVESPAGTFIYDNVDSISYGSVFANAPSTKSVVLTNTGSQILTYTAMAAAPVTLGANATGKIAAGASVTVDVTLTPTTPGAFNGTLTIANSDPTVSSFEIALSADVKPAPPHHFAVGAPATAAAGTAFAFSVTAQDAANNTLTGYSGTVKFSSSDAAALLPGNAALVSGAGMFFATLKTVGVQTLSVTDVAVPTSTGTSGNIQVNAAIAFTSGPAPASAIVDIGATFTAATNYPDAAITWDFGDASAAVTGANVTHLFTTAGTFNVTVSAKDSVTGATVSTTYAVTATDLAAGETATLPNTLVITVLKGKITTLGKAATIEGTVPIASTSPTGQILGVVVNSYSKTFTLDKKGGAKSKEEIVTFKPERKVAGTSHFKLTLKSAATVALISKDATLDAQKRPKKVLLKLTFGGQTGSFIAALDYSKAGKMGVGTLGGKKKKK